MVLGSEEEMMLMVAQQIAAQNRSPYIGILASFRRGGKWHVLKTIPWGADNECFLGGFDPVKFLSWLHDRADDHRTCRFILAPDVVGDYQETLTRLKEWEPQIHRLALPVGLALQDGATPDTIPWGSVESVFVGGSTQFKLSKIAMRICFRAKELGKWVHVGRVTTYGRIRNFWDVGDSFDGSHFNKFWKRDIPEFLAYCYWRENQISLPMEIR